MASEIFSLPEVAQNITQNLRDDTKSLYSIILVNRLCCRIGISLLWQDPFSVKYQENLTYHFIDIYLLFLSDYDKNEIKKLKFYKFDTNLHKPLFQYPSFIKTLNLPRMQLHAINWLNSGQRSSSKKSCVPLTSISYLQDKSNEELKLIRMNKTNRKIQSICITLFKLFIENNITLNSLHIFISPFYQDHFFNYVFEMILKNPSIISDVENFTFHLLSSQRILSPTSSNIKSFQTFLSSLPSSIKHIDFNYDFHGGKFDEFSKIITNTIQSQSQLYSIKIKFPTLSKVPMFDCLKYSSNTLTSIQFYSFNFYDRMNFDALSYLTQLESLQFYRCYSLDWVVLRPLLKISPLKIKTLVIFETSLNTLSVKSLIKKIGSNIENLVLKLGYHHNLKKELFDMIIDFCKKIQFLHLYNINNGDVSQLSKIIFNCNNYLKYLTIEIEFRNSKHFTYKINSNDDEHDLKTSLEILTKLSELLPSLSSLHYLDLNLVINPIDLKNFFDNLKRNNNNNNNNHFELKRLLIRNRSTCNLDNTLKIIKDFIKENNLEFFSYGVRDNYKFYNKNLKKLIKEIQSLVKMKNYEDLVVKVSKVDGKLIIN